MGRGRAAYQGEPGPGVEEPPVHREGRDHVVLALVGSDPPHEQPVVATNIALSAQTLEGLGVGGRVVLIQIYQQRADGGVAVPELVELGCVVGGVGHGQRGMGGEPDQLPTSLVHASRRGRFPPGEVPGRGDVVVVGGHRLTGGRHVLEPGGHGRLGGCVVDEQPVAIRCRWTLEVRPSLAVQAIIDHLEPDVRLKAGVPEDATHLQHVIADGVVPGETRDQLVDPHPLPGGRCSSRSTRADSRATSASRSDAPASNCSVRSTRIAPRWLTAWPRDDT